MIDENNIAYTVTYQDAIKQAKRKNIKLKTLNTILIAILLAIIILISCGIGFNAIIINPIQRKNVGKLIGTTEYTTVSTNLAQDSMTVSYFAKQNLYGIKLKIMIKDNKGNSKEYKYNIKKIEKNKGHTVPFTLNELPQNYSPSTTYAIVTFETAYIDK